MIESNPELRAAIEVAKQRVTVEPYFTVGMKKGLNGHAQGYWAGTILGGFSGALAGALLAAAFAAASIAMPVAPLAAILGLAGIGTVAGSTVGSRIGSSTGAISGVVGEFERRQKAEKLEAEILASPDKQAEVVAQYRQNPVVEKDDTVQQAYATQPDKAFGKLMDFKTMLLAAALCALIGALVCMGGFMLAGGTAAVAAHGSMAMIGQIGVTSVGTAALMGSAIGAAMGLTFGINYPMVFASLTRWSADLLSGKTVRGQSQFEPEKTVTQVKQEAAVQRAESLEIPFRAQANDNMPGTCINHVCSDGLQSPALQLVKQ